MRFRTSGSKLKTFNRVLRTYTWQEKVISALLILFSFYLSFGFFSGVSLFGGSSIYGRYSEGVVGQFQRINPLFVDLNSADRSAASLVFSGLVKYDPKTQRMIPDLADYEVLEDGKLYQFSVKEGITWHDGEAVDADDVYFTFHDLILNENFPNQVLKSSFSGVEVLKTEEGKIQFKLPKPNSFFISNLNVGILPEHLLKDVSVEELAANEFNRKPVGTGPYKVEEPFQAYGDDRMEIVLKANDNYYGGQVQIPEIRLVAYQNYERLLDNVSSINALDRIPSSLISNLEDEDRFDFHSYELPQYSALFLNQDSPKLAIRGVRLALQKALSKEELLGLVKGMNPVDTPLMELKQDEWIYQANPDEAKGSLYDSGIRYENEGDEFRKDKEGNTFSVKLVARQFEDNSKQEEINSVVDYVSKKWAEIGVQTEVEILEEGEFNAAIQGRAYDILLAGQNLGYNLDTYSFWHSSQANNGLNLSNYKSFAADKIIENIREDLDQAAKIKKLADLAEIIAKEVPAIFLYRPTYYYVTDNKAEGVFLDNLVFPSDKFADVVDWTLN